MIVSVCIGLGIIEFQRVTGMAQYAVSNLILVR